LAAVLRKLRHQHGGRADARPLEQKGAREVFGRHQEVPPGVNSPRNPLAQNDEIRQTSIFRFLLLKNWCSLGNRLQALAVRRHQCENIDADPLVWTNQRFVRWARNIDLNEYADNLKGRKTSLKFLF